jgi:hypothetical protein
MEKKRWIYAFCILGAVACVVMYGTGVSSGGSGFLRSFSADIGQAFSATFLKQEKHIGEFDFKNTAPDTDNTGVEECAFDAVSPPKRANILINEVAWMGSKDDYRDEWMELKNVSGETVDVSFWTIKDRNDVSFLFSKEKKILPDEVVLIKKKEAGDGPKFNGSLKNENEHLRLFDAECVLQDEAGGTEWEAGNNKTKQTMERDAEGFGWHTSELAGGTPGKKNSDPETDTQTMIPKRTENTKTRIDEATSSPGVQTETATTTEIAPRTKSASGISIIEVVPGKEGSAAYEFIKLKNLSESPVDLTGWMIKKKSSAGKETTLVSRARLEGKSIPANGYFLLANEGGYSGVPAPDVWWPKSYTLAQSNNAAVLYNPEGEKISEFSW